jgi:hypothetical protein
LYCAAQPSEKMVLEKLIPKSLKCKMALSKKVIYSMVIVMDIITQKDKRNSGY